MDAMVEEDEAQPARIETNRLILDRHRLADFPSLAAMWADPEIVRHIGGRPFSRQDSWMRLLRYRGLWPLLGYGYWAIREKGTDRFVGDLGFADFRREIEPPIAGLPEAGWALASWAHGKGFATEALAAALAWLDTKPAIERSVCLIDPANTASFRVASKNGFRPFQTIRLRDHVTAMLVRRAPKTCTSDRNLS
jgi:RimJ/RimL family protein N-acetyltransferase